MKKNLTAEEVRHTARLANLTLLKSEVEKFQKQLAEVLNYVEQLNEVETNGIEPTSQVTGLINVFREDEVKPSLSQEETLSQAKSREKRFFKVRGMR